MLTEGDEVILRLRQSTEQTNMEILRLCKEIEEAEKKAEQKLAEIQKLLTYAEMALSVTKLINPPKRRRLWHAGK